MSTELDLVGLQVWRGAFLLADYILSHPDLFKDQIILELGSGVGMTSIVASYLAKEVTCTGLQAFAQFYGKYFTYQNAFLSRYQYRRYTESNRTKLSEKSHVRQVQLSHRGSEFSQLGMVEEIGGEIAKRKYYIGC